MLKDVQTKNDYDKTKKGLSKVVSRLRKNHWLYIMITPGIIYYIIFKYLPMWGVMMSFYDFNPHLSNNPIIALLKSEFVGLKYFRLFIQNNAFFEVMRNTTIFAMLDLVLYFPIPIILALLLNEVRKARYKRIIQTLIYVPHFMSWVVIYGVTYVLLTTEGGIVNDVIESVGGEKIPFMMSETWFRPLVMFQIIWRNAGWGTIIFLAALSGVDLELYESAVIDGANRWKQMWYITFPAIRTVIVILFILRLGNFLDTGFEQIYLLLNALNREVGEVFDTYVYRMGIKDGRYSYSAAVGLFKSIIGLILVFGANRFAKKIGEEGIF